MSIDTVNNTIEFIYLGYNVIAYIGNDKINIQAYKGLDLYLDRYYSNNRYINNVVDSAIKEFTLSLIFKDDEDSFNMLS